MDIQLRHVTGDATVTVDGDGNFTSGAALLRDDSWDPTPRRILGFAIRPFQKTRIDVSWAAFAAGKADVAGMCPVVFYSDETSSTLLFTVVHYEK